MSGIRKTNPFARAQPSRESMIRERKAEAKRAPLWARMVPGKPVTVENVQRDVYGSLRKPHTALKRVRTYMDVGGPDIEKPVPLTKNPWRRVGRRR